jgi:hypothetical protein
MATIATHLQNAINTLIPHLNALCVGHAMLEAHSDKRGAVLPHVAPGIFGFLPPLCNPATITMIGDLKKVSVATESVAALGQIYAYAQLLEHLSRHGRDSVRFLSPFIEIKHHFLQVILFSFNGRQSVWARVSFNFKTTDNRHWKFSVAKTLGGVGPFIDTLVSFM